MATPGTYQVRLTVDGSSQVRDLTLLMDPRVTADGVTQEDVEAQLALNLKIRDLTTLAKRTLAGIVSYRKQVRQVDSVGFDDKLRALEDKFVTAAGRYQTPMLINQLAYLAGMTGRADQRPGSEASKRYAELQQRLDEIIAGLREIMGPL